MSDRYFYSLPTGVSGAFTYDYSNNTHLITMPYRPLKIIKGLVNGNTIDSIKITDENGIAYTFKPFANYSSGYTEWYLTKMISADATDTISLTYNIQSGSGSPQSISYTLVGPGVGPQNCNPGSDTNHLLSTQYTLSQNASTISNFFTPVLSSVTSSSATVNFTYANDRSDFSLLRRLSGITITPVNASSAIRTINFSQSYFGSGSTDYRLRLDSVIISSPVDAHPQRYGFTYESQMLPSYPFKMSVPRYGEDYWGYYNGTSSGLLFESDFISNMSNPPLSYGTNRGADNGTYAKACMIKEIKYPTEGKTVFHFGRGYATNLYPYKYPNNTGGYVGGFRIDSLTNYNENNQITSIKSYEYDDYTIKSVTQDYFYNTQYYANHFSYQSYGGGYAQCRFKYYYDMLYQSPVLPLEVAPGLPIMYPKVTEYNGTPTNNSGKTVYEYNYPYCPSDFMNNPEHPDVYEYIWYYHPYHYDKGNYVPELIAKTEYSYDGTTYHPISKTENTYTKLYTQEFETGIKLTKTILYLDQDYYSGIICLITNPCKPMIDEYVNSNIAIDTKAYQEASLITNSKNYVFNPADSTKYVLTNTDYTYNENNLEVKEKITTSSKGDLLKTSYQYPADVSGTVYSAMVANNMIAPVVTQTDSINNNLLQNIKTNYRDWGNNILAPETVSKIKGSANSDTLIRYKYNTFGNLVEASKDKDAVTSYLWGYNRQYPIAKIVGSNYATASNIVTQTQIDAATNGSGNDINVRSLLNNLRTGLTNAQVSTYTYAPAVGMTSQTDPSGTTGYYVYDGFGRLKTILDKDQNIIRNFGYNYWGQAENYSNVMYTSTRSQDFTRNNCGSGYTGGTVTYTAYATSYINQADADAKALADIAANGQNNANTDGLCAQWVTFSIYNSASSNCYMVEFDSPANGYDVWYNLNSGTNTYTIPAGTYDYIAIEPLGNCSNSFSIGCPSTSYISSGSAYFTNVTISSGSCYINIQ
jgi:YD repeat-containing protein